MAALKNSKGRAFHRAFMSVSGLIGSAILVFGLCGRGGGGWTEEGLPVHCRALFG